MLVMYLSNTGHPNYSKKLKERELYFTYAFYTQKTVFLKKSCVSKVSLTKYSVCQLKHTFNDYLCR